METKELIKEAVIDSGKAIYDYSFNVLEKVQAHTEQTINAVLDKTPWINEENRKTVNGWVETAKNGQKDVKALLDGNIKTFEKLLGAL